MNINILTAKLSNKWKRFLVIVITASIFYVMVKVLVLNWGKVPLKELHFNWIYLVLSFAIFFLCFSFGGYIWKLTLKKLGENLSYVKSFQIIALTHVGRYIPGKVWALAGQAYLAKKEGISIQVAVTSVLLMNIGYVIAGIFVAFGCMGSYITRISLTTIYILIGILVLCLIAIHPIVLNKLINIARKVFKKKESLSWVSMTYLDSLFLIFLIGVGIVIYGIGLYCLISSFYPLGIKNILPVAGAYAGSWVIGFLALIMPAGIGVREGLMSYFLSFYMPQSIAIITAIFSRIWITIGELVLFAFFAKKLKDYVFQKTDYEEGKKTT